MRGRPQTQATLLAFVDLEERVPRNHPPRVIKQFADRALAELSPVFDEMYAARGRPSISPERLPPGFRLDHSAVHGAARRATVANSSRTASAPAGTWACTMSSAPRR